MSDGSAEKSVLNAQRDEKIKNLGYLCYNLVIDSAISAPEFAAPVGRMQNLMTKLAICRSAGAESEAQQYEAALDDGAMQLGCLYFNMHIENRVNYAPADGLCVFIAEMSKAIMNKSNDNDVVTEEKPPAEENEFRVNTPLGMEPIPQGYRRCRCGYRNPAFANYCGKCGAKL